MTTRDEANRTSPRTCRTVLCAAMIVATAGLGTARTELGDKLKAAAAKASSSVNKTADKVEAVKQDPLGAVVEAVERAREQVEAIGRRVEMGASFLDGATLSTIAEQARGAVDLLKSQFEGKDEFVSQHAVQFKADLLGFLNDMQTLRHEIRSLTTSNCMPSTEIERTPLIDLVERMPVGFLYPVWKGLPDGFECLMQDVRDAVESIRTIHAIVGDMGEAVEVSSLFTEGDALSADAALFAARLNGSRLYLENHDVLSKAVTQLKQMSKAGELFSSKLEAACKSDTKVTVGVHGYALLEIDPAAGKTLAEIIGSMAKLTGSIATGVDGKLSEAKSVSAVNLILTNQEQILRNQEAILNGR